MDYCSDDESGAQTSNNGKGVQDQSAGTFNTPKAAKKKAAKRRTLARRKTPTTCQRLTCFVVHHPSLLSVQDHLSRQIC